MVALRNLDPLFGANQLLAQANSFFGQTWDPSREIDFNKMVDTENQYDIRSAQAEQAQLQSEYRNRMKEGMQGANSLEDVYRLKAQAAKELGLDSEYEKALQEQQDEDIRKQQRELPENTTLSARVDALQRAYLQNGDLDKALKIRPQNESKFFSYRGGIQRLNPETGEIQQLTPPMSPQGKEPDEYMYLSDGTAVKVGGKDYHSAIGSGTDLMSLPEIQQQRELKEREREAEKNKPGILDRVGSLLGSASGITGGAKAPPSVSANDIAPDAGTQVSLRNAAEMNNVPVTTIMVQGKPTQVFDFGPNSDPGRRYLKVNG